MIIFTKGIYKLIKKNIINEPLMNKQSNGSKWNSIFYSLSFCLFLLFFSFNTISAQYTSNSKSWKDKIISWKILKKPFDFLQSSNIKQPTAEMSIPVGFTDIEELIKKPVKPGAIVMALKRISDTAEFVQTKQIVKVLKNLGDITVRSSLVDYGFLLSETLLLTQANLL